MVSIPVQTPKNTYALSTFWFDKNIVGCSRAGHAVYSYPVQPDNSSICRRWAVCIPLLSSTFAVNTTLVKPSSCSELKLVTTPSVHALPGLNVNHPCIDISRAYACMLDSSLPRCISWSGLHRQLTTLRTPPASTAQSSQPLRRTERLGLQHILHTGRFWMVFERRFC